MASLIRKIEYVSRLQLGFLSATWLAGIYVNGFVPIVPGTDAGTILLIPAVGLHVVLASLSAATSVFIFALAWASGSKRAAVFSFLASASIVVAGDSGLAFVLGGASDDAESMIMATAFITAIFLTFLSMVSLPADPAATRGKAAGRAPLVLCCLSLSLAYAVFVTGIYVNLFVAGPVFSLPLNSESAAFTQAEQSAPFVLHELLGAALLLTLALLTVSLWLAGTRRLSLLSAVPVFFVAYSSYVGSLNLTSPVSASPTGALSALVPMLSAAGFMAAIVITMLLTSRVRNNARQR